MEVLGAYSKLTVSQVAAATSVRSSLSLQEDDDDAEGGSSEQGSDVLSPGLSEAKAVAGAKGTKQQEAAAAAKERRQE